MNVVIANISTIAAKKDNEGNLLKPETKIYNVNVKDCNVTELKAIHTNESIIKTIAELNAVKKSGGVGKIITLVSDAAEHEDGNWFKKTALDYYKAEAKACCNITDDDFYKIPIEDTLSNSEKSKVTPKPIEWILDKICKNISKDDVIYIDSAGGARTISNLIQVLSKILLYKGIKNPLTLYANIQNSPTIEDTTDFTRMTDLADAFNEFMTAGKSDQLNEILKHLSGNEDLTNLVSCMKEFSDKIRLGDVEKLDETILRLQKLTKKELETTSIESVIVNQFIPEIKENLVGNNFQKVDYVRIIEWCLKNSLIQQALTIFVEKTPIVLFEKKIIHNFESTDKINERKNKKINYDVDWRGYAFYTEILDPRTHYSLLRNALDGPKPKNEIVSIVYNMIHSLKKNWPQENPNISRKLTYLITANRNIKYEQFIDRLKSPNYEENLYELLTEQEYPNFKDLKTIEKKFLAIEKIMQNRFDNPLYRITIDKDIFCKMCYGYIYVKSVRNQTNHASSEENLNDNQKQLLSRYGYSFDNYDLNTVKGNISIALNAFKACLEIKSDSEEFIQQEEESFVPTTFKENDITKAIYLGEKKVRIENHNYPIQLVLRPEDDEKLLVEGQSYNVEIKQISKKLKIIQVKLSSSEA